MAKMIPLEVEAGYFSAKYLEIYFPSQKLSIL
jgi:hypothetical protein